MKKGIFLLAMLAFSSAKAQETRHVCGNSAADQEQYAPRLLENLAAVDAGAIQERGVQYVPIFFHLVGNASGSGRVRELRVIEQVCALNTFFQPVGMQFYLREHPTLGLFDKTINNNNVYTTQSNTFLMSTKRHNNAINYYIVDVADSGNSGPGLTLAYYSPGNDWIVSRRDQINGNMNNSTIAHETGHFFSLMHPFLGWESTDGFGPSYPGWPIAPVLAPDGGTTERQNGTNCSTAADRICDTGPDYKFAFLQSSCAAYSGGAQDPLGTLVNPMENNIMSYFDGCSNYQFTPLQMSAMLADLTNAARNYLDNTFVPVSTSIDTPTDFLVSPANNATTQFFNAVALEWNAVPNATHYLIELDVIPSFISTNIKSYITTNTSLLLTDLVANDNYYWRVKPFNSYVGCAAMQNRTFKTSSALSSSHEVEGLNNWQVSPNPANGDFVQILVQADAHFEANLNVVDAAGRVVSNMQDVHFEAGDNSVKLPLDGLANGFYFIQIDNGSARDVRKLVLTR